MRSHISAESPIRHDDRPCSHGNGECDIQRIVWRMIYRQRNIQSNIVQGQFPGRRWLDQRPQQREPFPRFFRREQPAMHLQPHDIARLMQPEIRDQKLLFPHRQGVREVTIVFFEDPFQPD